MVRRRLMQSCGLVLARLEASLAITSVLIGYGSSKETQLAYNNALFDTVRGSGKRLKSNLTNG